MPANKYIINLWNDLGHEGCTPPDPVEFDCDVEEADVQFPLTLYADKTGAGLKGECRRVEINDSRDTITITVTPVGDNGIASPRKIVYDRSKHANCIAAPAYCNPGDNEVVNSWVVTIEYIHNETSGPAQTPVTVTDNQ